MSLSGRYYALPHHIVPSNQETALSIRPLFEHSRFEPGHRYQAACYPAGECAEQRAWTPETRAPLTLDEDAYQYASCVWCFDKIREARGLGIFCHP